MQSKGPMCVVALMLFATVPVTLASTTWYANGVTGSDSNNCLSPTTACKTIGHVISLASSGDSIMVAAATYTENLIIGTSLKLIGAGASTTIIDGGGVATVVTIPNSTTYVTLAKLTMRNGHSANPGGGISNEGVLTINRSTISGNTVSESCAGSFCGEFGGGILNDGWLTIHDSTISGNSATVFCSFQQQCVASGGGIWNAKGLYIKRSTISGNGAGSHYGYGGGIFNAVHAKATIANSTITGNSANEGGRGGGLYNDGGTVIASNVTVSGNGANGGGNIAGGLTIQNSIIANALFGGNCSGGVTSNGYNLSSDGTCNLSNTGDRNNTNPLVGTLGNYGGPTKTIPLLSGSPAIDAGNPNGCTDSQGVLLKTDQRGYPRPDPEDSGGCDIGAFERQSD